MNTERTDADTGHGATTAAGASALPAGQRRSQEITVGSFVRVVDPQSVHHGERVKVLDIDECGNVRIESSGGGVPTERAWFERRHVVPEPRPEVRKAYSDTRGGPEFDAP